jgi:hypothetical protein
VALGITINTGLEAYRVSIRVNAAKTHAPDLIVPTDGEIVSADGN